MKLQTKDWVGKGAFLELGSSKGRLAVILVFSGLLLLSQMFSIRQARADTTATTDKTWSFASDAEGLADVGNNSYVDFAHDGAGAVKFTTTRKNLASATEYARWTTETDTWATWGVPSGYLVTDVQITAWKERTVSNTLLTSHTISMRVIDSAEATVHSGGDLIASANPGTGVDALFQSGAAGTKRSVNSNKRALTTQVRLELQYVVTTGNGTISVDQRFDDIVLTITYSDGVFSYRKSITIDRTKVISCPILDARGGTATGSSAASTLAWSHITSSAANRILIVGVAISGGTSPTVSTITYGAGQSLVQVTDGFKNGTNVRVEIWKLVAPNSGTATITVTLSGVAFAAAGSISFTNVHQTTPLGTFKGATGTGTAASVTGVSSAKGEIVVDMLAKLYNADTAPAANSLQSPYVTVGSGSATDSNNVRGAGSTRWGDTTSVDMSWTLSTSREWAIGAVSVKPPTDATLTNFPMLVKITGDADLYSRVTSASGYDIIFRATDSTTCGGTSPCTLNHQIEKYTRGGSTDDLWAWVNIPSMNATTATTDTVIYMYYGNSSITTSTETTSGTAAWDANYKGVWHLNEAAGTSGTDSVKDSTSGASHGTPAGTSIPTFGETGQIYTASDFAGLTDSTQRIQVKNPSTFVYSNYITLSAWVRNDAWPTTDAWHTILSKGDRQYRLSRYSTASTLTMVCNTAAGTAELATTLSDITNEELYFVIGVCDATNKSVRIYVGDTSGNFSLASATFNTSIPSPWFSDPDNHNVWIGSNSESGIPYRGWNGIIDEARISDVVRSEGWMQTKYNNQYYPKKTAPCGSDTTGFYCLGDNVQDIVH